MTERRGREFVDLASYLREVTEETNPTRVVLESTCGCRATAFLLEADAAEGCARRVCQACGAEAFLGDSEEFWSQAEPEQVRCDCDAEVFEIGVGYSFRADDEVSWLTVGSRCLACGLMTTPVDWKIDYAPTEHLFEKT